MEIRQLRYFVAVARDGSFSAASQRIRVAQPALSAQIAKLEVELGRTLFDRHPRGVHLTEAGQTLLYRAGEILGSIEDVFRSVRETRGAPVAITIGVPPLVSMMLTVPLVERVAAQLPHVSLQVIEGMSGALKGWLADRSIDVAFLHNVGPDVTRHSVAVVREDLYVAASVESSVRLGPEITARDLVRLPVIASTARNSHRQLLEAIARRYGTRLTIAAEVDSIPRQHELVQRGIGVLVMPLAGFTDWAREGLQLARLTGAEVVWDTCVVPADTSAGLRALQTLKPVILDLVRDLVRAGRWPGVKSDGAVVTGTDGAGVPT